MPRGDGTGPTGVGPRTGRGLGFCNDERASTERAGFGRGFGRGLARRFGFGRGFGINRTSSKTKKEWLGEQKNLLQDQIKDIDRQLENL